jgi:hypothetical protein
LVAEKTDEARLLGDQAMTDLSSLIERIGVESGGSRVISASDIGRLAQAIIDLAPSAGLYVEITIRTAPQSKEPLP